MSDAQFERIFRELGAMNQKIDNLNEKIEENYENTVQEHRTVHNIVAATSEATRNITRRLDEMEPLTDDYRERRAEERGAAKLRGKLMAGGAALAGVFGAAVVEIFNFVIRRGH